jgi:tetratricopeptide (TPR) repeat protein
LRPEAEGHLERIGQAYEGHPLVIEVIAGEILAHPFNGNVALYWQRYGQEFEMIALATNSQMLELRAKDRVREALTRLSQDVPAAYTLLCYSSVYRRPVPESFWLAMLQEPTLKEKVTALETLKYRRLFEEIVAPTNQFLIRQHHLIQCVAYDLLQETDKEAAHYIAANRWIMAYEPEPDVSNLEQVRAYLEAFYHFCEVENWEVSSKILSMSLDTPTNEQLHKQLGTWGYYHEQIELYNRLLGKINLKVDCYCLNNLGTASHRLSNCLEAIEYFKRSLNIARQIGDSKQEENALGNLGNVYHSIGKYREAIKYHQQSLTISCKIGDRRGEGIDQCNLALAYSLLGKPDQAIEYLRKSLLIAREIGNRSGEAHALGNLALVYRNLGKYDQAIEYDRQSLTIESEIGDRYGEADQLRGLGLDYLFLGDYEQAIDYHQQSLIIAQEINAYGLEGTALCNLGVALIQLKEYSEALKYLPAALEILKKIGYRHGETITLYNLAVIYYQLNELDLAQKSCDRALSIATELGLPLVKECQELKKKLLREQA